MDETKLLRFVKLIDEILKMNFLFYIKIHQNIILVKKVEKVENQNIILHIWSIHESEKNKQLWLTFVD